MHLGLDEIWSFDSCPTQDPCWTVTLGWLLAAYLLVWALALEQLMIPGGQMFPDLRQGRSRFFGSCVALVFVGP